MKCFIERHATRFSGQFVIFVNDEFACLKLFFATYFFLIFTYFANNNDLCHHNGTFRKKMSDIYGYRTFRDPTHDEYFMIFYH